MSSRMCYTPLERFFGFSRRSSAGASIPTWPATPGPLYMKCQVHTSKMDPRVEEVELLQANPHYAQVRYPDGRETTVATKHLAPRRAKLLRPSQHQNVFPWKQRTCQLTHLWVFRLMQNHRLRPNLHLNLNLNLHLHGMWNLHLFVAPNEFVVQ